MEPAKINSLVNLSLTLGVVMPHHTDRPRRPSVPKPVFVPESEYEIRKRLKAELAKR